MSEVPFGDGSAPTNIKKGMICTLWWAEESGPAQERDPGDPVVIENEVDCYVEEVTVVDDDEIHIEVFVLDYSLVCDGKSLEDQGTGAPIAATAYGAELDLVAEGEAAKIVQLKLAEDRLTNPGVGPLSNQMGGSIDSRIPLFLRLKHGSWEAPRQTYHILNFITEILKAYAEGKYAKECAKREGR